MSRAWLSLGSNIEPERHLAAAVAELRARFANVVVSPAYASAAVGFEGPEFINLAAGIDSDLGPRELDAWLHALEDRHGRRRDVPRWSSRTLDVDILLFGDHVLEGPGNLKIPRPELDQPFVLVPLADIAGGVRVPGDGRTLAELRALHGQGGLRRLDWHPDGPAAVPVLWQPRAALFDGPLDVVGDIHGEADALDDLLGVLGYRRDGRHPTGRRLVFVGDLCDRGPDSVAVLERVGEWIDKGLAQCVLGNHELNLLREARREGNGWYFDTDHDRAEGKFLDSRPAGDARRWIRPLLATMPLALEDARLRVVHACWDEAALAAVEAVQGADPAAVHDHFEAANTARLEAEGTLGAAARELERHGAALHDATAQMPLLPALARRDAFHQAGNPLRVLTSGVEREATAPFFSSGKWRMVERVAWWQDYHDAVPVAFGHYWRLPYAVEGRDDLFGGAAPGVPLGPRQNVHCVDYSVGRRFQERERGGPFRVRLAALRWPGQMLAFEDGHSLPAR